MDLHVIWESTATEIAGLMGITISPEERRCTLVKTLDCKAPGKEKTAEGLEARLGLPVQGSVDSHWALAWSSGVERYAAGVVAVARPEET